MHGFSPYFLLLTFLLYSEVLDTVPTIVTGSLHFDRQFLISCFLFFATTKKASEQKLPNKWKTLYFLMMKIYH